MEDGGFIRIRKIVAKGEHVMNRGLIRRVNGRIEREEEKEEKEQYQGEDEALILELHERLVASNAGREEETVVGVRADHNGNVDNVAWGRSDDHEKDNTVRRRKTVVEELHKKMGGREEGSEGS